MRVGDLIEHTPSGDLGLIIQVKDCGEVLVKWLDKWGAIEDVEIYHGELEVVSESRGSSKNEGYYVVDTSVSQRFHARDRNSVEYRL